MQTAVLHVEVDLDEGRVHKVLVITRDLESEIKARALLERIIKIKPPAGILGRWWRTETEALG